MKIFGCILLSIGIVIILGTLLQSYNIFTGRAQIPEIFSVPLKESSANGSNTDVQKQLEDTINKQIGNLVPSDSIPKILNLISWSILAGILILGGSQLSGLGIRLLSIKRHDE